MTHQPGGRYGRHDPFDQYHLPGAGMEWLSYGKKTDRSTYNFAIPSPDNQRLSDVLDQDSMYGYSRITFFNSTMLQVQFMGDDGNLHDEYYLTNPYAN